VSFTALKLIADRDTGRDHFAVRGSAHRLVQFVPEHQPVRQSGERIVPRQVVLYLCLGSRCFRDVLRVVTQPPPLISS